MGFEYHDLPRFAFPGLCSSSGHVSFSLLMNPCNYLRLILSGNIHSEEASVHCGKAQEDLGVDFCFTISCLCDLCHGASLVWAPVSHLLADIILLGGLHRVICVIYLITKQFQLVVVVFI